MPDHPVFNPGEIISALEKRQVSYVLIGGLAAVLHGSPLYTGDADVCPARDRANLERLAAALKDMDSQNRSRFARPVVSRDRSNKFAH